MQMWKPQDYDAKLGFVSEFGRSLLELLDPKPGESILDVGCGTGDLSGEIAEKGAKVTGADLSAAMIESAKQKYPNITFVIANAEERLPAGRYDAVFSNAALHWMKNADNAARNIADALRPGGRFVAEFGGAGNVAAISGAICRVLSERFGIDGNARFPWYFPTIGEYTKLLEDHGFLVRYARHFDRPTRLNDGENGLRHWLDSFAGLFFRGMSVPEIDEACKEIERVARGSLFKDDAWYADYRRIRVTAEKR